MNTLIPGAPLRSLSPTTNEYQRAQGESRAAKPARAARFTLDAPEHSGTIPGARGDILTPGVALTSNLAVIFTLNQHKMTTLTELKDIEAAHAALPADIRRTPILPLGRESAEIGNERCFLKCENLQVTGAYKVRAAFTMLNGSDHIDNLQLLCGACNSVKGDRSHAALLATLKERGIL